MVVAVGLPALGGLGIDLLVRVDYLGVAGLGFRGLLRLYPPSAVLGFWVACWAVPALGSLGFGVLGGFWAVSALGGLDFLGDSLCCTRPLLSQGWVLEQLIELYPPLAISELGFRSAFGYFGDFGDFGLLDGSLSCTRPRRSWG